MADTISTKRITDLPEDTNVNDNDLFMAGSNGTASLRKKKWSTLLAKIKSKLLANNLTTTAEGYALDARQGKILKDQLDQQNTKINNLRSWYDEYYVKQGYGARVKYKDGSTPMPDGVYLVDAVITGTSMDTYTRYLVRIRQPAGIYKITELQTVSSPGELQVNLYWGGESTDQLSIMTNNDTQYYTVTLGITQIA